MTRHSDLSVAENVVILRRQMRTTRNLAFVALWVAILGTIGNSGLMAADGTDGPVPPTPELAGGIGRVREQPGVGDGTTAVLTVPTEDARIAVVEIEHEGYRYEISPDDGPVLVFITERTETRNGVSVSGIVVLEGESGYAVAGEFRGASEGAFAEARVDDVLVPVLEGS